MPYYERARSTGEPTKAAVRLTLGFLIGLVFPILTLNASAAGETDTPLVVPVPANTNGNASMDLYVSWLSSLGSANYNVVQGNVFLFTNDECQAFIPIFNTCFGQNPAAPYIFPEPPIEDSDVDPDYAMPFNTQGPAGETNIFYRLTDNDALITVVSYPPKAAYFGYISYAFSRGKSFYEEAVPPIVPPSGLAGGGPLTVSPDQDRFEIFGSIGNDVNNVIVQNQLGVSPWADATQGLPPAIVAYITTSNTNLANALVKSAQEHGIDPKSIFIEPIGSNILTGGTAAADDMWTVMRYAVPQSNAAAQQWLSALAQNVLVYKVSNPSIPEQRYGANQYTRRTVNTNERSPSLSTALQQLATLLQVYLTAKQQSPSQPVGLFPASTADNEGFPNGGLVGSVCIEFGTFCLGDDPDTSTYAALPLKQLGNEETAFVVGVNHNVVNLNNTRYVSVGVYNGLLLAGVASASQTNPQAVGFDSGSLNGSAQGILQALGISIPPADTDLIANLPSLYVTAIARDINNRAIATAPKYTIDLTAAAQALGQDLPATAPLVITERSYIVPGTTTGGNVNFMLYPMVVAASTDFCPPSPNPEDLLQCFSQAPPLPADLTVDLLR